MGLGFLFVLYLVSCVSLLLQQVVLFDLMVKSKSLSKTQENLMLAWGIVSLVVYFITSILILAALVILLVGAIATMKLLIV